jgi:hypothetical protein
MKITPKIIRAIGNAFLMSYLLVAPRPGVPAPSAVSVRARSRHPQRAMAPRSWDLGPFAPGAAITARGRSADEDHAGLAGRDEIHQDRGLAEREERGGDAEAGKAQPPRSR